MNVPACLLNRKSSLPSRLLGIIATSLLFVFPSNGADLTFYAYSDCHYGAGEPPKVSTPVVDWINGLPGTPFPEKIGGTVQPPKAVIMSGDLIDNGANPLKYAKEWADYIAEFGVNGEGRCRFPVFEGMGNHDWNANLFAYKKIAERNRQRKELGLIQHISENGYHYSWDWDGIHFVNLNIFPGNQWAGEADTYSNGSHDPLFSRDFLEKDLRENVGNSGRPVILVHHFRPIDENWWTFSAADKYHRIIQDYNVILIMVGHQGGGVNNTWRGINWASSNGELEVFRITPDNVLTAIARKKSEWGVPMQKKIYLSYETSGLPAVVNNGEWTSDVTTQSATLTGKIIHDATDSSEVTIYWGKNDGGDRVNDWDNAESVGRQKVGDLFKTTISGLTPWTEYFYRCRVTNSKGEAWAAASIPFRTRGLLPESFNTMFVGHEQRPWGGAHMERGTIILRGSGRDIGERGQTIDNFQYGFTASEGDAVIKAHLTGMEGKTRAPLAGVMFRETEDAGSKSVSLLYGPKQGLRLFTRSEANGKTLISKPLPMKIPVRLKLARTGNTFTAFVSQDGENWTPMGETVTVEMPSTITAGLAVTAGNRDGSLHQDAFFDEVTVE
jgi:hypothetical protein